jgi:hypothetical protein
VFKIIKKDNISSRISRLIEMDKYDYMDSNEILLDSDLDEMLTHVYLRGYETLKLGNNEMKNILGIVMSLDVELDLGYDQRDYAYNLVNLNSFIDELSKNNIKLVDYSFNWFMEQWINSVCIILYKDDELIFYGRG